MQFVKRMTRVARSGACRTLRVCEVLPVVLLAILAMSAAFSPALAQGSPLLVWKAGGHIGVTSIAVTPDGGTLVSGSGGDNTVKVWSVSDAAFVRTLAAHYGGVHAVAVSPDGAQVASAGEPVFGLPDGNVILWRLSDGAVLRTFATGYQPGQSVAFSPNGTLLAAGVGQDVRIWRLSDGALVRTLTGHTWSVFGVAFSPDGTLIASASGDNSIKVWRTSDGALLRTLTGHTFFVMSIAFSPDGATLVSGSFDQTVRLWRVSDGASLGTLTGHSDAVYSVAFSPGGTMIASGSADHTVKLWAFPSRTLIRTIPAPYVNSVAFGGGGAVLAGGSFDGYTRLWNPGDGTLLRVFGHHTGFVNRLAFAPSGQTVGTISQDVTGRLWRASDGFEIASLVGHTDVLNDIDISSAGVVATCSGSPPPNTVDPSIRFWRESDGGVIRILPGHPEGTTTVDFHPDGATIASGGFDDRIRLWRVSDGVQTRVFTAGSDFPRKIAYSPDGALLAVAGSNATLKFWDPLTSTLIRTIPLDFSPSSIDFSPDGATIVVGLDGYGNNVQVFRVEDGTLVRSLIGHPDGFVHAVSFAGDNDLVASTSGYTFEIRLWRVSNGALLADYGRETGWGPWPSLPLDFSPDGTRFAYGRADASVALAQTPMTDPASVSTDLAAGTNAELQASPNPFVGQTTLTFRLDRGGDVEARILDLRGRVVRRIKAGNLEPGKHSIEWDGRDEHGRAVASGIYFAQMRSNERVIAEGKVIQIDAR